MAALRPVEERDAKGNTIRLNPSITYLQAKQTRAVVGRHDWRLVDNDKWHQPITAQVQNGEVKFFHGTPDNSQARALAKEISVADVAKEAPYILEELKKRPMRVREARPTVYEVKIAMVGDVETTVVTELDTDGESVTVTPVAPQLSPVPRAQPLVMGGAPS